MTRFDKDSQYPSRDFRPGATTTIATLAARPSPFAETHFDKDLQYSPFLPTASSTDVLRYSEALFRTTDPAAAFDDRIATDRL